MAGSCHRLDSIGSSVKLTNMLISTAATMVMPNSWKNLPTMPPMKPMGRNTATMDSVVASTASPISCVPSSAAACALLPICTWRTMFSRTTMASSMSRPTHRLIAISVTMLIEKPNMCMNRKVPINAIGSARPVITVERHEFRNRKTMPMVSSAPSISVRCTLRTDTRIGRELSRTASSAMPLGSCGCSCATTAFRPSTTSMVFSPCDLRTSSTSVRSPLNSARFSISSGPSTTSASWPRRTGAPFLRATIICAKSSGRLMRASTFSTFSVSVVRSRPAGSSWLSARTAASTCSTPMPIASIAAGRR